MSPTTMTAMAAEAELEATTLAAASPTGRLGFGACYHRDGVLIYSHESPETLRTQAQCLWDFAAACREQ